MIVWYGVWNLNRLVVGPTLLIRWGFRGGIFPPPAPPPGTDQEWLSVTLNGSKRRGGS